MGRSPIHCQLVQYDALERHTQTLILSKDESAELCTMLALPIYRKSDNSP
jgi:hypothetical protein